MLTRIRIEVSDEDSAAACEEALTKYERALHGAEGERFGFINSSPDAQLLQAADCPRVHLPAWTSQWPNDFAEQLGREVTDEVIEYDPSIPGYKGRRVVQYRRVDTRKALAASRPAEDHSECLGGGRFCATSVPEGVSIST